MLLVVCGRLVSRYRNQKIIKASKSEEAGLCGLLKTNVVGAELERVDDRSQGVWIQKSQLGYAKGKVQGIGHLEVLVGRARSLGDCGGQRL